MRAWTAIALLLLPGMAAASPCPGYSTCPSVNYMVTSAHNPQVKALRAEIADLEAASAAGLSANGLNFGQLVALLGQTIAFDSSLSVRGDEACAFCHVPQAGFSGGIRTFAAGGGVFPGAVTPRTGFRTPQSLAYAAFAPVLAWRPGTQDFAGGNFWDSRATGLITGSPGADQAMVPLTNPFEMALPDPACAVRRIAQAAYGPVFGKVWGANALAITWPADTDALCAKPNDGRANQTKLALSPPDRARATLTVQQIGLTIATYEESRLASPFTSKFDAVLAGSTAFTPLEKAGYVLFKGAAHCAVCHDVTGTHPLLTNFTSANIGAPRNPALPYLTENAPDPHGYVANPAGPAFIDQGLGGFLASAADTNPQWQGQASRFMGAFQVPTLRNIAARAAAGTPRSYMHNGSFTSLKMIVHFYNTRDVLPVCTGTAGAGVSCWPAPEVAANVNHALMGNLGLSDGQEAAIVAFLTTLTDNFLANPK